MRNVPGASVADRPANDKQFELLKVSYDFNREGLGIGLTFRYQLNERAVA